MSDPSSSTVTTDPTSATATTINITTSTSSDPSTLHSSNTSHDPSIPTSSSSSSTTASSTLLDDSLADADDDDDHPDSPTNLALRPSHGRTKAPSTSSSTPTPPNPLLRGLSLKAVQSSLSKSLSVALQYTKEKIGRADATTEEEQPFLDTLAAVHSLQAQLRAAEKTLASLITAQQTSILAHDGLSATLKRLWGKEQGTPTPRSGGRRDSTHAAQSSSMPSAAADPIASIEAMTSAFTESAKVEVPPPAEGEGGGEDEKGEGGGETGEAGGVNPKPSINPSAGPPTPNYLPSFYPYSRRLLSGRLVVSDSYASLLASVRQLQATVLKAALAAISQLEIDRLHYDACQANMRTLTTPDPASTLPTPTSLEAEHFQLKVDAAQLVYLRSKAACEERAVELVQRVTEEVLRGLTSVVAVEQYEWQAGVELLKGQVEGKELEGRKRTNPWGRRTAAALAAGDEGEDDDQKGLRREVDALR